MERSKSGEIKKIRLTIGDRNLGTIDLEKGVSNKQIEEMLWNAILGGAPVVYAKGVTAQIHVGEGLKKRFKVKKSFIFHGSKGANVYVTIPITLDALKGLGFISKVKG